MSGESSAKYVLYGAPYCHLCDDAKVLLESIVELSFEKIDISRSFELKKTYGMRIPVFKHTVSQDELNWPFDRQAVLTFTGRKAHL